MINSILDNDTYKVTMQQAIARQYPKATAEYAFIDRGTTYFPNGFARELRELVNAMASLVLTPEEEKYLRNICYYLKPDYIDMLRSYRYDPKQVEISQDDTLHVTIRGPWYQTVLWEVPLLAMISELYFRMTNSLPTFDWMNKAREKFVCMSDEHLVVSDFGTRRRYSFTVHHRIVDILSGFNCCAGTSNLYLAMIYGVTPIGTMAHEWAMAHAAMFGYKTATKMMLKAWVNEYEGELGIALPDTFGTEYFLKDFGTFYSKLFDGIRWDSGPWQWFTDLVIDHYKKCRIDPNSKVIVFSDNLTDKIAIDIARYCQGRIKPRFGIGTFLTNDVGVKPLNMVIKMTKCNGYSTVKLSDSPGKELGSSEEIRLCKESLQLEVERS